MKTTMRGNGPVFHALLAFLLLGTLTQIGWASARSGLFSDLFHTSDRCLACHNQLTAQSGQDISIGFNWRSSMMGNSGRDPYWMAGVRREALDHPAAVDAIEDKCTVCHLPIARTLAVAAGEKPRAFQHFAGTGEGDDLTGLARDGVSCAVCHQIQDERLGTREGFTGGYVIDLQTPMGERRVLGPFTVDAGRTRVMHSSSEFTPAEAAHVQSAELCATCHTLFTHALDPEGNEVGELPEQTPYLEWLHSDYSGEKTCQDCHMPEVEGEAPVTGVLPNPRSEVSRHVFRGGNFFMPRLLNRYRAELDVSALPQELEATALSASENLGGRSATLGVEPLLVDGRLAVTVSIRSLVGHKLPSGYPSRRAWIHLAVRDADGRSVFESGAFRPDGSIAGNDNDDDGSRFEPHYDHITEPGQVQIYEDVMVDYAGKVTTGLLYGARYVKDNRLLPVGFEKTTAPPEVAVRGAAEDDPDFEGSGDRLRYTMDVGERLGPFTVEAELWYQPIGYRWAKNLVEYPSEESARFVEYFDGMARTSATLVARATTVVRQDGR